MQTISVSFAGKTIGAMERLVEQGFAPSIPRLIRDAVERYVEHHAVEAVLRAEKEPRLEGDLDELVKRFTAP